MLIQTFYPAIGGAEKQALNLSIELISRGIKVLVLTRKIEGTKETETISGVVVQRLKTIGRGHIDSLFFMISSFVYLIKHSKDYEIIHVHLASSLAIAAILAGKLLGKKVIIKMGGGKGLNEIGLSEKSGFGKMKLGFFSLTKSTFLVLNKDILNWLKTTQLKKSELLLFKNGVDTGKYAPLLYNEKIKAKTKFNFDGKLVFLFVGRLSPEKRIMEFIEVWSELTGETGFTDKAVLHIVGPGPLENEIKESIKKLGIESSVIMAGKQYELKDYYAAADIFVLPSISSEGLSNSMLEAMSCGLAIMASKVGGAKEAVEENVNGFLFDQFNIKDIKKIIMKFIETDKLALEMGEKSREITVKRYSVSKVTDELLKIYNI